MGLGADFDWTRLEGWQDAALAGRRAARHSAKEACERQAVQCRRGLRSPGGAGTLESIITRRINGLSKQTCSAACVGRNWGSMACYLEYDATVRIPQK